jgi:hypothetical protein
MTAAKSAPAAGASGGRAPLPATIFTPEFLRFYQTELRVLLNVLRSPLATHLFFLLVSQADFNTGEQLTNYARLIELCTLPAPERGRRKPAPSLWQVRNALDELEEHRLIKRNKDANAAQGMLRIYVKKRKKN